MTKQRTFDNQERRAGSEMTGIGEDACDVGVAADLTDAMHDVPFHGLRQLIRRLPQWIRTELSSHDAALRERAEDALYGMISAGGESSKPVT